MQGSYFLGLCFVPLILKHSKYFHYWVACIFPVLKNKEIKAWNDRGRIKSTINFHTNATHRWDSNLYFYRMKLGFHSWLFTLSRNSYSLRRSHAAHQAAVWLCNPLKSSCDCGLSTIGEWGKTFWRLFLVPILEFSLWRFCEKLEMMTQLVASMLCR